jgi:predicted N-acetyltransferase YhbS
MSRHNSQNGLVVQADNDPTLDPKVEALYDRVFGPGRFAKAAARLREGNLHDQQASRLGFHSDRLVGACRLWPVAAQGHAMFLGPIAVEPDARGLGVGHALTQACLAQVDDLGGQPVLLVGDMSFFGDFGFVAVPKGLVDMPGPVDPARFLVRGSLDGLHGMLRPRPGRAGA